MEKKSKVGRKKMHPSKLQKNRCHHFLTNIYLEKKTAQKLKDMAEEENRTIPRQITYILEKYLADTE